MSNIHSQKSGKLGTLLARFGSIESLKNLKKVNNPHVRKYVRQIEIVWRMQPLRELHFLTNGTHLMVL